MPHRDLASAALLPLLLPLLLTAPAAAQDAGDDPPRWEGPDIRGRVVDLMSRTPIVGAEVSVLDTDRRTFTDQEGRFVLPDLAVGENVLMVRNLGYEDLVRVLEVEGQAAAPGDDDIVLEVVMEPRPVVLEGIEVVGDKFERRVRAAPVSTRVVDRDDVRRSSAVTALDLLRQRGGVHVGHCPSSSLVSQACIVRFGRRVSPEIWVDEIQSLWGLDELDHIPAGDVYRLEVYDRRHVRVYTVDWMRRASVDRPNLPYLRFPNHFRPSWRSSRGPG